MAVPLCTKSVVISTAIACFLFSMMAVMYIFFPPTNELIPENRVVPLRKPSNYSVAPLITFPSIVHHTWKTGSSPPSETIRWRDGCKKLNAEFDFRMYDDDDLYKFTEQNYPEYFPLFKTLKGVYMADMARLLITYHYGGTYLDLDFYCFRPFHCLQEYAVDQAVEMLRRQTGSDKAARNLTDLLIVSREPAVHATIFRNKERVVIQDFFMATPRHPFIRWILDDRMAQFRADPASIPKGPFSYAIEKDIDKYYAAIGIAPLSSVAGSAVAENKPKVSAAVASGNVTIDSILHSKRLRRLQGNNTVSAAHKHKNSTATGNVAAVAGGVFKAAPEKTAPSSAQANPQKSVAASVAITERQTFTSKSAHSGISLIVELKEEVLHPLVDATNSHLYTACKQNPVPDLLKESCRTVDQRRFFNPTDETMLVHMWTHTFLGWSFVRGAYNAATYRKVEGLLKPTFHCPYREQSVN